MPGAPPVVLLLTIGPRGLPLPLLGSTSFFHSDLLPLGGLPLGCPPGVGQLCASGLLGLRPPACSLPSQCISSALGTGKSADDACSTS